MQLVSCYVTISTGVDHLEGLHEVGHVGLLLPPHDRAELLEGHGATTPGPVLGDGLV